MQGLTLPLMYDIFVDLFLISRGLKVDEAEEEDGVLDSSNSGEDSEPKTPMSSKSEKASDGASQILSLDHVANFPLGTVCRSGSSGAYLLQ